MKLNTPEDVQQFALGVRIMRQRYDSWLQSTVVKILEEEILIPLWEAMREHEYSEKIIEGTDITEIIRQGSKILIKVRSVYTAVDDEGKRFDVARAREYGTKPHWVEPKKITDPLGLHQGDDEPEALHWISKWGESLFSKGHITGGIEARHLVERIVKRKTPIVKARIRAEFIAWKQDIFNT